MRRIIVAAALLAVSIGPSAGTAVGAGPDFSSCADVAETFGPCVANIAQSFRTVDEHATTTDAVNDLVASCRAFSGEQFGACMAAAAQGAQDRGDPPGAAVADAARSLVDGCRGQEGQEF